MALMVGPLYDVLKSVGADDDKARKAAEEVTGFGSQIGPLDHTVTVLDDSLLQWMVGTNIALTIAVLWPMFS